MLTQKIDFCLSPRRPLLKKNQQQTESLRVLSLCLHRLCGLAGGWRRRWPCSFNSYFRLPRWRFCHYKIWLFQQQLFATPLYEEFNYWWLSKNLLVSINLLEHGLLWTKSLNFASSEAWLSLIVLISNWQNVTSTGLAWVCSKSRYPTYALKPNKKCTPGLWYLKRPKWKILIYSAFCKHPLFWVWTYSGVCV